MRLELTVLAAVAALSGACNDLAPAHAADALPEYASQQGPMFVEPGIEPASEDRHEAPALRPSVPAVDADPASSVEIAAPAAVSPAPAAEPQPPAIDTTGIPAEMLPTEQLSADYCPPCGRG